MRSESNINMNLRVAACEDARGVDESSSESCPMFGIVISSFDSLDSTAGGFLK